MVYLDIINELDSLDYLDIEVACEHPEQVELIIKITDMSIFDQSEDFISKSKIFHAGREQQIEKEYSLSDARQYFGDELSDDDIIKFLSNMNDTNPLKVHFLKYEVRSKYILLINCLIKTNDPYDYSNDFIATDIKIVYNELEQLIDYIQSQDI